MDMFSISSVFIGFHYMMNFETASLIIEKHIINRQNKQLELFLKG
jgi:hypothetical protein